MYLGTVVKCRPPGNRDPRPDEIEACKGYLRGQLETIQPRVVITLGNFATKLLLKTDVGITRVRGHAYPWWGRHLVPTFHPAAALRGGEKVLSQMRHDFALAGQVLESPPETPGEAPEEELAPPEGHHDDDAEQLNLFA